MTIDSNSILAWTVRVQIAATIVECSKLDKLQLKRLSGKERKLIEKMQIFLKQNQDKDADAFNSLSSVQFYKLNTHLTRITSNPKKNVSWITAIFRDLVKSSKSVAKELNSGKIHAQAVIRQDLVEQENIAKVFFNIADKPIDQFDDKSTKALRDLEELALRGDGYAIYYLMEFFHKNNAIFVFDGFQTSFLPLFQIMRG